MSSSDRCRSAGTSPPSISVNRYNEPRSRNEKSTLLMVLIDVRGLAVGGATTRPLASTIPGTSITVRMLIIGLTIFDTWRWPRRDPWTVRPIDPALAPAGLVQQLHSPAPGRVRIHQQLRIFQHGSARITSHLHSQQPFPTRHLTRLLPCLRNNH